MCSSLPSYFVHNFSSFSYWEHNYTAHKRKKNWIYQLRNELGWIPHAINSAEDAPVGLCALGLMPLSTFSPGPWPQRCSSGLSEQSKITISSSCKKHIQRLLTLSTFPSYYHNEKTIVFLLWSQRCLYMFTESSYSSSHENTDPLLSHASNSLSSLVNLPELQG